VSEDVWDSDCEPLCDHVWEYVDTSEYDGLVADHDDLCRALDTLGASRRLRRDTNVRQLAERLRSLVSDLWSYDDGHSDYGHDGPNFCEWDHLYPIADACVHDAGLAIAALTALADLVHELFRAGAADPADQSMPRRPEPLARPPSLLARSAPDLALAPPLPRVALPSDDVTVATAA